MKTININNEVYVLESDVKKELAKKNVKPNMNKTRKKCHEHVMGFNTAGEPLIGWTCYCGTTGCLEKVNIQNLVSIETYEEKRFDELTPEEEERFYKKVFNK